MALKISNYLGLQSIFTLSLFCTLLLLPSNVQAQYDILNSSACDCGFRDAQDPTAALWTTYWESDFTQINQTELTNTFRYNEASFQHGTGASRTFEAANVAIDSAGLHLTVQPINGTQVPSAGIYTKSEDFGFGSYHFEALFTNISGTVEAFYVYKNDSNEVDVEYVSKDPTEPIVNFSVKPQIYLPAGGASNLTYQQARPAFDLSTSFHNYSFVWNASAVRFGIDGNWSAVLTSNVPPSPGVLSFTHWSDGNPNYSGGPPVAPATLTIKKAYVFYNATGGSLPCVTATVACSNGPLMTASSSSVPSSKSSSSVSFTNSSSFTSCSFAFILVVTTMLVMLSPLVVG